MATVDVIEAKAHLSALLDRVAAGEEITITRHGQVVARLVRADEANEVKVNAAAARLKALRAGTTLEGDWKALRDEGRTGLP